ncbi:MAG: RsmB/NOP family class I SAM-dependent RNA methyltransferase [Lachnospiraceae bacterium]|nr:RsmB/NOP family class I SAM-dependent RNA methyltransferase [Lachnospiraceae bacterium]
MIQLPQDFMDRMQDMLKDAYPAFLRSYAECRLQALRVNALKGTRETFLEKAPFSDLRRVPWEENGFYYDGSSDCAPGKHPFHQAGVYYIQEPSAMAPAAYLEAVPGERVLDLCAAPGGKTTQIASYMQNQGFLVCNEIHSARAKILSENVERMGIRNALVTNETPQRLAELFGDYFDRILVDAPCSGEGMFRKNEEACSEWSLENVQLCADRQDEILDCADRMLRPGGRLVYATCTFAPAENEGSIARFLERHPEYQILEVKKYDGMSAGTAAWANYKADSPDGGMTAEHEVRCHDSVRTVVDRKISCRTGLKNTIRLFPHLVQGEGHYVAVLQKNGEVPDGYQGFLANGLQKGINAKDVKEFLQFQQESLQMDLLENTQDRLLRFGEQLYLMPECMPSISKLKVLRAGLHLGTLKKNRFEPSHALALALKKEDVKRSMELDDDEKANAYLEGMTLNYVGEKGWYLMTYRGYSIGWGKLAGQVMKNHYPKGLRK